MSSFQWPPSVAARQLCKSCTSKRFEHRAQSGDHKPFEAVQSQRASGLTKTRLMKCQSTCDTHSQGFTKSRNAEASEARSSVSNFLSQWALHFGKWQTVGSTNEIESGTWITMRNCMRNCMTTACKNMLQSCHALRELYQSQMPK